jgi:predicted transcriptional regulator
MNNTIISLRNNQQKNKISLILAQSLFQSLLESNEQDAVVFKIINYLLLSYKRHKGNVFPAQDTIAQYAQCSREYVNRILKHLSQIGLIRKKRIQYTSCSYWLHPLFHDASFRWKFKHILPALKWSALFEKMKAKLASNLAKARTQITLLYNKNYINIKNTFSSLKNKCVKEESVLDSYKTMLRKQNELEPKRIEMNYEEFNQRERQAAFEPNYHTRLSMYEKLYKECPRANQPFISLLIKKTQKKIQDQLHQQTDLLF